MAHFKIYLLTTDTNNADRGTTSFLQTPVSEFYSQQETYKSKQSYEVVDGKEQEKNNFSIRSQKNSYCFTFNEKLSLHSNGQKDFSFSMTRKTWLDDAWITNPFVDIIHSGSQILLIDKYNNEMFFTIKKVAYNFKKDSIIYNYTCQDSFTYQAIRQNDGYTIENNVDSEDFIGAKTIDWWVLNKIKPDCHLMYEYVPLFQGIYLSKDGELKTYMNESEKYNVEKIIKPIYSKEKCKEYYETIPFSLSSGNCSSALISLGESLGLSLNVREHHCAETNKFLRYFWYEPKKHEEVSNLEYSPTSSIQSFSLTQAGDALTTVLNVESNTINDEIISLIPDVPPFFYGLFFDKEWKTLNYSSGYFTSVCQRKVLRATNDSYTNIDFTFSTAIEQDGLTKLDNKNRFIGDYLYISLQNTKDKKFRLPKYYNKIDFEFDNEESFLYIDEKRYTPKSSLWTIVEHRGQSGTDEDIVVEYDNIENSIPLNKQNQEINLYLKIYLPEKDGESRPASISQALVLLNFYRDYTEEEFEFAEFADKCPWLENKLIDFSYFYNNGILTKSEYNNLFKILQDELRIQNGLLLLYSKQYYESLHQKTQKLANIINDLDSLGASFHSDVINSFAVDGSVKDYSYFKNAYNSIISNYFKSPKTIDILNYDEIMTDCFNKYFKAQQKFLKNIYQFKQFFEAPSSYGNNSTLYRYITTLSNTNVKQIDNDTEQHSSLRYITFKQYNLALIGSNFTLYNADTLKPYVDVFNAKKEKVSLVHKENMDDYYLPKVSAGTMIRSSHYNPKKTYYRILYKIQKDLFKNNEATLVFDENNLISISMCKHHSDETHNYYGFLNTDEAVLKQNSNILEWTPLLKSTSSETTTKHPVEQVFYPVGFTEMVSEYFYRKQSSSEIGNWYYHNVDTSEGISKWLSRGDSSKWKWIDSTKSSAWRNLFSVKDEMSERWKDFWQDGEISSFKEIAQDFYVEKFPITSVEYRGPRYKESAWTWIANDKESRYDFSYQIANKNNQTIADYVDYWIRSKNGEILPAISNPGAFTESQTIPLVTPENESNYYRRVVKAPFWGYAVGALTGMAGFASPVGLSIGNILSNPLGILTSRAAFGVGIYKIVADAIWDASLTIWDTKGHNKYSIDGGEDHSYKSPHKGYFDYGDEIRNTEKNYTTSSNAYNTYLEFKSLRKKDFIAGLTEASFKDYDSLKPYLNSPVDGDGNLKHTKTALAWCQKKDDNGDQKIYALISSNELNQKNYFDYYQLFGFTYSDLCREGGSLFYTDRYIRPLALTDYINVDWKYSMLIQTITKKGNKDKQLIFKDASFDIKELCESNKAKVGLLNRISKIIYHPIASNLVNVDFTILPLKDDELKNMKLGDALEKANYTIMEENNYWITAQDNSGNKTTFMIFQEEPFKRNKIIATNYFHTGAKQGLLLPNKRYSLYFGETVYDDYNAIIVDLKERHDIVTGFYEVAEQDSNFVKISSLTDSEKQEIVWKAEDTSTLTKIYSKNDTNYERVYSIEQAKIFETSFYFLEANTYTEDSFDEKYTLRSKVFLHEELYNKDNKIIGSTTVEYPDWIDFTQTSGLLNITYKDKTYQSSYKIDRTELANLTTLSNGDFWYQYHDKLEFPTLNQHAALIESQLTQYWMQAYSASKYCEFFLPESWQPRSESGTNHFAGGIIQINDSGKTTEGGFKIPTLKLLNTFIPEVKIYYSGNTSRLPRYQISYRTSVINFTEDSVLKEVNQNNIKKAENVFSNNIVFRNIFQELGETYDNYYIEELESVSDITKTTYYYTDSTSGVKWNNTLSILTPSAPIFEYFNGLYIMQYNIFKKFFSNLSCTAYENAKQEHDRIWNNLYQQFPGIILENTYSNKDATTSTELFTLSTNAFKDMSQPENGYSISLIDAADIMGYSGQEITVGDAIRINANEFYSEANTLKNALSQFLFVTDISYDLRKDTDIQLTVNSIKYQDKLIQRLVKLIK